MHVLKLVFGMLLFVASASADTVRVAVAANFRVPMQALETRFETVTPHQITISAGASGLLYAQITQGAPFDVFLSADATRPMSLIQRGDAVQDSQFTYATGRLFLMLHAQSSAEIPPDLSGIRRISIANPRTAPYGAAAQQVLGSLKFPDGQPLIAEAPSVSGVNAAMAAKAVDAGFAAYASVVNAPAGQSSGWLVPSDLHAPIQQDAVLLSRGASNAAAIAFLDWLKGAEARQIIKTYGYDVD